MLPAVKTLSDNTPPLLISVRDGDLRDVDVLRDGDALPCDSLQFNMHARGKQIKFSHINAVVFATSRKQLCSQRTDGPQTSLPALAPLSCAALSPS